MLVNSNLDQIIQARRIVWESAAELVQDVVEQHGIEKYSHGTVFQAVSVYTKVEQHINHIITVADWLLNTEEN